MQYLAALLCAPALLAGCGDTGGSSSDPMVGCIAQIQPPGTYEYAAGIALPVATPGPGGTQEGADALNACARQRVLGPGALEASVAAAMGPQRIGTQTSGGVVRSNYTYGKPPSAALAQMRPAMTASPSIGSSATCPVNAPVIYGGAAYCFR
ncbi:hypothetical protein SAMN05421759_104167 [Roseivivax lentus]|uniref:Lipoprotein n=1 Tax=Roseivivax lentus TaxID=633194 RepID=A0A1N7MBQ3_9RHOB|nr:hypothetical protein [Roseivivax lentus]SIS83490.1 hypothetical protein SAMN05421759_104167 [Roseivivax lentus]